MWPNKQETAGLVTYTEEILNRKLNFLHSGNSSSHELFLTVIIVGLVGLVTNPNFMEFGDFS